MIWLRSIFALAFVGLVPASPVSEKRQAITALSLAQINEFAPFTHFAGAAYCTPSTTLNWSCGGEFVYYSALKGGPEVFLLKCRSLSPLPGDL